MLTLQTGGIPEAIPDSYGEKVKQSLAKDTAARTMLQRAATLADVGALATFAASDLARSMTATALNLTAGAVVD